MSTLGWHASLPLELGGDFSPEEKSFNFLKVALGEGGSSPNEDGIDWLRNSATAIGMAAIESFDERAAIQAFPHLSIDAIPWFEELLGVIPSQDATEQQRREVVTIEYVKLQSAEIPSLTESLQEIDPRFSVLDTTWAKSKTSIMGRQFQPVSAYLGLEQFRLGPTFARAWSEYPNYSDRDIVIVLFNLGSGVLPSALELASIRLAQKLLNDVLPSWNQGYVITELGFVTAQSLTGYAGA